MPNRKLNQSNDMRRLAAEAVARGVRTPVELSNYFTNNGWEYDMPTRPTLEKLLNENGVKYISGYWMIIS